MPPNIPVTVVGERSPAVQVNYPDKQTEEDEKLLEQYRYYLGANNAELAPEDIDKIISDLRMTQDAKRQESVPQKTLTATENPWQDPNQRVPVTVQEPGKPITRPPGNTARQSGKQPRITPDYLMSIVDNLYKVGR